MPDRIHELKTWPEPFEAMNLGFKTFEYRRDDRGYMVGDVLRLREWDPGLGTVGAYTGRVLERRVTYVLHGGRFGVPEGFCVMSLESTDADQRYVYMGSDAEAEELNKQRARISELEAEAEGLRKSIAIKDKLAGERYSEVKELSGQLHRAQADRDTARAKLEVAKKQLPCAMHARERDAANAEVKRLRAELEAERGKLATEKMLREKATGALCQSNAIVDAWRPVVEAAQEARKRRGEIERYRARDGLTEFNHGGTPEYWTMADSYSCDVDLWRAVDAAYAILPTPEPRDQGAKEGGEGEVKS